MNFQLSNFHYESFRLLWKEQQYFTTSSYAHYVGWWRLFNTILHSHTFLSNACTFLQKSSLNRYCCQQILKAFRGKEDLLASSSEFFPFTPACLDNNACSQFWFTINLSSLCCNIISHIIIIVQEVSDVENLGN